MDDACSCEIVGTEGFEEILLEELDDRDLFPDAL